MTITKPKWIENQTITGFDDATLGFGASSQGNIDMASLGFDLVAIQIEVIFGGSPDDDALIEIQSSPDSGTTFDSIAITALTIEEATSTTKRLTVVVPNLPFIRVKITNNDSADDIAVSAIFAGRNSETL